MCCGILCKLVAYVLSGLGIAAIIIGAVLGFAVLPNNISEEVDNRVRLRENTPQFDRWRNLSLHQQVKIYFFEVDNAVEVQNGQAIPRVIERGPYVYNQLRIRNVRGPHPISDTLSYTETRQLVFDSIESGSRTENDAILMLNFPLVDVLHAVERLSPTPNVNNEIPVAFPGSATLFHPIAVRNFLFEGFRFCPLPAQATTICNLDIGNNHYLQRDGDGSIIFTFLRHKISDPDNYEILTGIQSAQDVGLIINLNGATILPVEVWGTDVNCRAVRGRDGTIFPPGIRRGDILDTFHSNICRAMTLEAAVDEDFEDIPAQRREFLGNTLHNTGTNTCFCSRRTRTPDGITNCWPNGFLDLGTCTGGHVILSYPHFLGAAGLQDTVQGLNPRQDLHESYTILEPGTGTPLKIVRRFQYNMVLRPIDQVTLTSNVRRAVIPLLWIEESMELPQEYINKIRDEYLEQLRIVTITTWVLIGGGIAMFIASLILKIVCC